MNFSLEKYDGLLGMDYLFSFVKVRTGRRESWFLKRSRRLLCTPLQSPEGGGRFRPQLQLSPTTITQLQEIDP
jgi:hypothetical protein